ncbi:MAG: glycosyltransferase family 4 protein [Myxococcales bacterium]|nr:glycosyltransferase family 4 protein [Myxococcales bacterium]MCB9524381.1 glycosyltransferase family 4 protein [Myxococcales bacterium]
MRIAYLTDETFPNRNASGLQIVQTLSALHRAGAAVDMVFPAKPGDRRGVAGWRDTLEDHFHVPCPFGLVPLPTWLGGRRPPIKVAHGVLGTGHALRGGYDLIYTRTVAPIAPALAARRWVLFETYRPLTRQFGWSRRPFVRVGHHPRFVGIVTHSKLARQAFVEDGLPEDRVRTVYNGFDPAAFAERRTPSEARALLGLPERPTVVYTGRIAPVKSTDLLLDAAARTPEAHWVLAGADDTEEARPYVERARAMPNVTCTGYLTGPQLVQVLQAGDVLVVPPSAAPLQRFGTTVLPIKVFTYLAAHRAIVAGDLPDAGELLTHERNSLLVRPDDVEALAGAVRRLVVEPALRDRLATAAAATSEALTWPARAERILDFIQGRTGLR